MNKEEHLGRETAAFLDKYGRIDAGEGNLLRRVAESLTERDAAREELATLKAAHPESAPVVGGVTEAHLDKIESASLYQLDDAINEARAAIRAQKRVDVEAIREVAQDLCDIHGDVHRQKDLRRAIGDEPAEAPVAEPAPVMRLWQHDETGRCVEAFDQPGPRYIEIAVRLSPPESTAPEELRDQTREMFPDAEPEPAEPAAPAQEQEGPYNARGLNLWENGKVIAWCNAFADLNKLVRLLNLGVEAEKLRARVAELEAKVAKREAQFLEAITARPEATQALRNLSDALGLAADSPAWGWQIDNMAADRLRSEKARADAAEAKLAALGENPIPRALGERWHSYASGLQSGAWFAELLAGREPGVAS